MDKPLMTLLEGGNPSKLPAWFMRQAGRYLPEYRAVRQQAGGFLDLCYTPELACEVTLQPIRRFGFDAAILFSDILVIPHALGLDLRFAEGEGPILETVTDRQSLDRLSADRTGDFLAPVFKTVSLLSRELPGDVTLIGFCGAPWTVASYMVAGRGTPDQAPIRLMAYREPELLERLIDRIVEASVIYLRGQMDAGADCLQIFDTWAGVVPASGFERWVTGPIRRIVEGVRETHPGTRFIGFPKGCGDRAGRFAAETGVDAVGLDWTVDFAALPANRSFATQGNLDPMCLVAGGEALDSAVQRIVADTRGSRHIFNLGHGIVPQTPIAHVERALEVLRASA